MSQSVIIVGGSLSGLMQGLRLKRQGHNVTIIEQDTGSERSSYEAGITVGENVEEFLRRFDATGLKATIPVAWRHFAYRKRPDFLNGKGGPRLSNWIHLYRILRANFDQFASAACPNPPSPYKEDGKTSYLAGKRVTELQYSHGIVTVYFEDVRDGRRESIEANLVIGADGIHSTVRKLLNVPTTKQYAGYVSWRGSTPEETVSPETAAYFNDRLSFDVMKRTYMICYVIPTEDGNMEPGKRLLNWVWYYNMADGSPDMAEIFTDVDGNYHRNTVPRGLVQPSVWDRVRTSVRPQMATPFAELLEKTKSPFVTKINDALCTEPSFYDGHVILVGDALTAFRPHIGLATEQAALHSLTLDKVDRGEKTHDTWIREIRIYARSMFLLNRLMGEFGTGSTFSFLKAAITYLAYSIKIKLGWAR
ncbi:FAD binding domain protein [Hypoxylon sp. FL1857]|nr:FAD binding domain protein [Hypoxylon sp. FL1857]